MTHASTGDTLMSVCGLLASLAWAIVAVLFIVKANAFAHRWLGLRDVTAQRQTPQVEVPDDLIALAMGETEKWAQDDYIKIARERYETFGDWNKVRAAMGIGSL